MSTHTLAQSTVEEWEAEYEATANKTEKIRVLLRAARDLSKSDPIAAQSFVDRGIKEAIVAKNSLLGAEGYSILGNILMNRGQYNEALTPLKKAVTYRGRRVKKDPRQHKYLAADYHLLGLAFEQLGNQKEADRVFTLQLRSAQKSNSREEKAKALNNLGKSQLKKKSYKDALSSFNQAKVFAEEAKLRRTLVEISNNIRNTEQLLQSQMTAQEFQRELESVSTTAESVRDSLQLAKENNNILISQNEYYELEVKNRENELKLEEERRNQVEAEKQRLEELQIAQREKFDAQERTYQIILLSGIIVGLVVLLYGVSMAIRARERKEAQLKIQEERDRADKLLENILPKKIAEELKEKQTVEAVEHPKVAILFTDFQGFTRIAAGMKPTDLLKQLEYAFMHFDQITYKYGLEKIKTIGDAYMAVAGLITPDSFQSINAVAAAMEMQEFMAKWNAEQRSKNQPEWKLRVGIHTGKVVAGVIPGKKFAYDIWGDAVNVASRMESAGEASKVNISETTFKDIEKFVRVEPKRTVPVKNRGEVGMYFVKQITAKRNISNPTTT
ncbi:MAG: adenylate/guanylate cyclase domain-containing protein [Bacteroidota bacterium]